MSYTFTGVFFRKRKKRISCNGCVRSICKFHCGHALLSLSSLICMTGGTRPSCDTKMKLCSAINRWGVGHILPGKQPPPLLQKLSCVKWKGELNWWSSLPLLSQLMRNRYLQYIYGLAPRACVSRSITSHRSIRWFCEILSSDTVWYLLYTLLSHIVERYL